MKAMPVFDEASRELCQFLSKQQHPSQLSWAFRQDFYSTSLTNHWVAWPLPEENHEYARSLYEKGRERGLAELKAVFTVGSQSIATVFAPMPDEIQGWDQGLKLFIRDPFVSARPVVNRLVWQIHKCRWAYRRFQRYESSIPERNLTMNLSNQAL